MTMAAAIVVLAVGAAQLNAGTARAHTRTDTRGGLSRLALERVLGVLRAPATAADRSPVLLSRLRGIAATLEDPGPERLDAALVRAAGRTPWGAEVVLAGFETTGQVRPGAVPEMAGALVGGAIDARAPASEIRVWGLRAYVAERAHELRVVIVAPDGVARVRYEVAGASVAAPVRNNVAAFVMRPVPRLAPGLFPVEARMIWYARDGRVVRRVPSELAASGRGPGARSLPSAASARARRGTFVSLVPACACGRHAELEEFSERDGRLLRRIAPVPVPAGEQLSTPAADAAGKVLLTYVGGPKCGVSGIFIDGCPQTIPNSCTNTVDVLANGKSTTMFTIPGSEVTQGGAVPNPAGTRVALAWLPCTSRVGTNGLFVLDVNGGGVTPVMRAANFCSGFGPPAWNRTGTELVFPYARASHGPTYGISESCPQATFRLVIASASGHRPLTLLKPDRGCEFGAAAFDRLGIAAAEGCSKGSPPMMSYPGLGDAYLLQYDAHAHLLRRLALKRGLERAVVATDPHTGNVLVTQYQPANNGGPEDDWVWEFDGSRLRPIAHYRADDAAQILAIPW